MHRLTTLKLTAVLIALTSLSSFAFAENTRAMKCEAYEAPTSTALAEWLTAHPEAQTFISNSRRILTD